MRSKKAIYNVFTSLILQFIVIISGFIIPKLIIKSYGSEVNGLISSITQFLAYITLLESGIGPVVSAALYKPLAKKDNKKIKNILRASEKFFRIISLIFIAYLVILSIVYPIIVQKEFNYLYTLSLIIILSISTFFEYYYGMVYKIFLQANQETYIISLIQIVTYILNIAVVIILIKLNCTIHIVKLLSGILFILRPLIQNVYVKKKYNINLNEADKEYKLEKQWDGLAQHIAAVVHSNTDITVLTFLTKLSEVSVYSVYGMITRGVKSFVQAFSGGLDASFGDMIAKNENTILNKNFSIYEFFHYTICTIFYSCTLLLIVPFVRVYTSGITDVNYIRPAFGYLIVISEFIWAIRLPYSTITLAAGHFKETRKGAWIEAISNIIISIILVIKFGIVGVAIGTIVAMTIRTVEFIYHANKYILKRNILVSVKKILTIILETIIIILIVKLLPTFVIDGYFRWLLYAVIVFCISAFITIITNLCIYKNDTNGLITILKNNIGKIFLIRRKK